ncbi:MAG: D-xylose transport system substrate-binding protein [Pyrinomonadaceae bacterium]|jgi:D-xylose transport system substrate-binding protein|nr:D-xylose transport system substrate-binding protein [Pyrinomonadaceae bacterium]
MGRSKHFLAALLLVVLATAAACTSGGDGNSAGGSQNAGGTGSAGATRQKKGANDKVFIGFLMDTLKEERWQRDKDLVEKRAAELGAQLSVQVANSDDNLQIKQAENLLSQKVDVLIVAPHNSEIAATIVEMAHREGVPVISYDRLIKNSDVDLYVSHQVIKIGELQADYILKRAPKGNYVVVQGSATDNNARLLHDGQMNILKPAVDRGDIKIVVDQPAREWLASEALNIVENALTQFNNEVVAVIAANDGTARGAIQALDGQRLAGKVLVSGQDADLASLQYIVEGKQTMTIYKPIQPLAYGAVDAALKLARGQQVETNDTVDNGRKKVPSMLYEPLAVDKNNIGIVVKDGYQTLEKICEKIPADQCPKL